MMRIAYFMEYIFRNQHNHSEFAHFCLFLFLGFLFYTFLLGFKDQLEEKLSYQKRKLAIRGHQDRKVSKDSHKLGNIPKLASSVQQASQNEIEKLAEQFSNESTRSKTQPPT